jgi:HTH-type transcriptional regulator/antitoxin HipB
MKKEKSKTIPFRQIKERWMKDKAFRKAYDEIGPEMELAFALAEARNKRGLTQTELAKRIKTSQTAVARLESGRGKPTWETIKRYARAVGARASLRLVPDV